MEDDKGEHHAPPRKQRLAAGGISAPVAIVVAFLIHDVWETDVSNEEVIAISSLIGSGVTMASLCFWDFRELLLEWLHSRRKG